MDKVLKKGKRFVLGMLSFPLMTQGYSKLNARLWTREVIRDYRRNKNLPVRWKRWAHDFGFTANQLEQLGIDERNIETFISYRDYKYLQPVSGKYAKWIDDKITTLNIFKPFRDYLPTCYYQVTSRDGQLQLIQLPGCPENLGHELEDILALLRLKKKLIYALARGDRRAVLSYSEGIYYINDQEVTADELGNFIKNTGTAGDNVRVISEYLKATSKLRFEEGANPAILKLYIINSEGDNPQIGDAFLATRTYNDQEERGEMNFIPVDLETGAYEYQSTRGTDFAGVISQLPEIKEVFKNICTYVPQIEFMGATVILMEGGFKIQWFNPEPPFLKRHSFSPETVAFLKRKAAEKREAFDKVSVKAAEGWDRIFRWERKRFTRAFFPKTMLPYLGPRWIYNIWNDFWTNKNATFKEKMWAYRHGFLSYRLKQYGIDQETKKNFISDFEYMWLRHINPRYKEWFEDKITIKYILSDFKECFPAYYYHITVKNGQNKIIPMMDCPEGFAGTFEDIFKLAKEKKLLALKPDEGSHGEGFYKLSFEDGKFYLNSEEASEERIIELLQDVDNQYLITEYIQMHPELKKIYPASVNTIRLTVWKMDGIHPTLGNGYMRFGSSKTGVVDNVGAGGIGVDLDVKTGRFYNAQMIENNSTLIPCPIHPDTGEKIEGHIPNWDYVSSKILEIAAAVPQVEYLGFDVAVTEDGIKFPEINRFPDYPRINPLTPETMSYLLYKLRMKKERLGYDQQQPWRLFKLPKRD